MRRNNRGGFSIYSGSHTRKEELKPGEVAPRPVSDFKTLEENIAEELRIAGLNWIGRRVEYFWAYPLEQRGFYAGAIIDYKKLDKDTQYLIQYDEGNRCEWEVVDTGFRFLEKQYQTEVYRVLELRQYRCDYFVTDTAERIRYRLFFPEKDKHTMVGIEYQVDLEAAFRDKEEPPIGEPIWIPNAIAQSELNRYLEMTAAQLEPVSQIYGKPKEISFIEDHSTTTFQATLDLLHKNNYNVESSNRVMKREGVFWCYQKPDLSKHWTSVEVAMFELEMKMAPKKFNAIFKSFNEKEVSGKTLHDIVQFFWYWKSTANYKQWKKKDRISIEGAAHFRLDHAIALKQAPDGAEISRNPRLRKRPRVDYSESNLPLVRESPVKTPERRRGRRGSNAKNQPTSLTYDLNHYLAYPDLPVLDIRICIEHVELHSGNGTFGIT